MKTLTNLSVFVLIAFFAPVLVSAATLDQAIVETSDFPELLPQPLENDPLGVTVHRLSNGMTVYISTNHEEPKFDAWIVVRSGSRMDPANSTGLAHYLEHMLFKGTDEYGTLDFEKEKPHLDRIAQLYDELRDLDDQMADGMEPTDIEARREEIFNEIDAETQASAQYAVPNELDQIYATMGFTGINAFTWHDMTVYIADVPSNRLNTWVTLEAERFSDPQFRLFYPELEAVYEEKNISLDEARERVDDAMHLALYPEHPYGTQPTIGIVDHLKTPAYGDMVEYFKTWYQPNNMAICLAGDITPEQALPALEEAFAVLEPKPLPAPAPARQVPLDGREHIVIEAEGENSVTLAWQAVGVNHPDYPALTVMDWLMANSKSGIIDVELVLSQKLPSAYSSPRFYREAGHFMMYGQAKEGQSHDEVEALLLSTVDMLKHGTFTQDDIDAVVLQSQMSEMTELESNGSRVGKMAEAYWNHTPWREQARNSERLSQVTKSDVLRVANQYLGDDFVSVHRVKGEHSPPKVEAPEITPVPIDPSKKSEFAKNLEEMPVDQLQPTWIEEGKHYKRMDLPTGDLVAVHNDMNELFTIEYTFDIGRKDFPLLSLALDLLQQSGTSNMSPPEFQSAQWNTGTTISMSAGVNTTTVRVSGINRNLDRSLELLNAWFSDPMLDPETLTALVENRISQRKDQIEEPRAVSRALAGYAFRGEESSNLIVASNAQLQVATVEELKELIHTLPKYEHETDYFGPLTAKEAAKKVVFGTGEMATAELPNINYRKTGGETQIYFTPKETAQATIFMMFPKEPMPEEMVPKAELYNNYVGGGMGGLIFQEVREARGLAYGAGAWHLRGDQPEDQSGLQAYVGTQGDKTMDALNVMLGLLRELPEQPDRVVKAKSQIDQRLRATRPSPRRIADTVRDWDLMGYKHDPRKDTWEKVGGLTTEDLVEFGSQFAQGDLIIAITGDPTRIDMEALAQLGKIHEVGVKDIFGY